MFSEKKWARSRQTYFKKKQESMDQIQPSEELSTAWGKVTGEHVRFKFAKKMKRLFSHHDCGSRVLGTRGISMYVDGVGFIYKSNPYSKTPSARKWRLKNETLEFTTKGKKEGEVQVKFLVGVGHNAGVVLCKRLTGRMNGKYYTSIIRRCFRRALKKMMSPKAKRILVDRDPSQNSKVVMAAIQQINERFFWIPATSPDLDPIENLFHLARKNLNKDAHNRHITTETMEQFADGVQCTLMNFKSELIDNIIETIPKRIGLIIKNRGSRI